LVEGRAGFAGGGKEKRKAEGDDGKEGKNVFILSNYSLEG